MAEADDVNRVVDEIAERVRRRIGAAKAGREEPCEAVSPNPALRKGGYLTRDSRVVERKKYGKAKARRSFQFSKR